MSIRKINLEDVPPEIREQVEALIKEKIAEIKSNPDYKGQQICGVIEVTVVHHEEEEAGTEEGSIEKLVYEEMVKNRSIN